MYFLVSMKDGLLIRMINGKTILAFVLEKPINVFLMEVVQESRQ